MSLTSTKRSCLCAGWWETLQQKCRVAMHTLRIGRLVDVPLDENYILYFSGMCIGIVLGEANSRGHVWLCVQERHGLMNTV